MNIARLNRRSTVLAILLVGLVFLLLAGFAWNFVRDTIAIPIFYVLWVGDLILKSIPESTYLIVLVVICLIITLSAFQGIRAEPMTASAVGTPAQAQTRYRLWRTLGDHLYTSRYFREQFVEESRKLILVTLAYQEGVDVAEAESMVLRGTLPVPQAVNNLIRQKTITAAPPRQASIFRRKPPPDAQLDRQVAEIIGFMEHLLEINNAGNQP